MSELGRVPAPFDDQPIRAVEKTPAADSSSRPDRRQPLSFWSHIWNPIRPYAELPLLAALGATFGCLTGMGLWSELHEHTVDFVLWAVCLGAAAYVLFDPAMDLLYEWLGAKRPEFPEGRKKLATLIAALATLLVSAVHHSLDISFDAYLNSLESKPEFHDAVGKLGGWAPVLVIFVCVGVAAAAITYLGWMRGAKRQPSRATHYGFWSGIMAAIWVGAILFFLIGWGNLLIPPIEKIGIAVLLLLLFVFPGILGGWVIDKQQGQEGKPAPTRDIFSHLAVFSVLYGGFLLVIARFIIEPIGPARFGLQGVSDATWKQYVESDVWLPVTAVILLNLGWALAPYFRREFCDRILAPSAAPAVDEHGDSQQRASAAAVEIPRRDTAPATAAVGAAAVGALAGAGVAAAMKPTEHARELLLKPKGDRLWATLALLLSLATSAAAYHLGTLRKDTDISANVVKNFQQDSGLQSSGLNAQANDHIVTLTGTVANQTEREAALRRALAVRGVKQVIDEIQVAPPRPAVVTATEADGLVPGSGPGGATPGAEINANISIGNPSAKAAGGPSGKPVAEAPAKPTPAKVNGAKSAAEPKASESKSAAAKANGVKPDETKASAPASRNPLSVVKNAFTKSSTSSGTSAKPAQTDDTASDNTTKKSKNPFSFVKNKIKKPKTSNN